MQEMREKEDGLGNGTSATHAAWFDVRFRALSDINAWPSACRRTVVPKQAEWTSPDGLLQVSYLQ
jgi:hypothetical protein